MGERLIQVGMRAFRGVRDELTLEFARGASAVVLGENGTGKSTLADALEWYFTGELDLLRHEGRAGSLRHVGAGSADLTSVSVQTTGVLGGELAFGGAPSERVRAAGRETFLLRGRTLTAFVERTKGEKWKALAQLLGLEDVDQLRLDLQRVRNDLQDAADAAAQDREAAARALIPVVSSATEEDVLDTISRRCATARVPPPVSLQQALDPEWAGSLVIGPGDSKAVQIARLSADLRSWSPSLVDEETLTRWNKALEPQTSAERSRLGVFRAADSYLAEAAIIKACPLCGQAVDGEALRRQIRDILTQFQESADAMQQASGELRRCANLAGRTATQMADFRRRADDLGISVPELPESPETTLSAAPNRYEKLDRQIAARFRDAADTWLAAARQAVDAAVTQVPAAREGRLVELGLLLADVRTWRERADQARRAVRAAQYADSVFQAYAKRQQASVADILDRITSRAAEIYGKLHPREDLSDVCIEPWGSKGVELAVSFHGSRQRPPHGVLSESHLNSLAVALFLAMADTFNDRLDFLILDDVMNSFDIEHRGQLARLLATDFAHRQLLVLTHDQIFYDRLARLAPSWKRFEFTSWDFGEGPRIMQYQTGRMLQKAQAALADGDRPSAAMMGRRALEEALQEACEGFSAPLPFRRGARNDRREIGETFHGLRSFLKECSRTTYSDLKALLDGLEADVATALNPEAHASQNHPSSAEVRAAIERICELDTRWTCPAPECRTRIWHRGTPPVVQCRCGRTTFPPPAGSPSAGV